MEEKEMLKTLLKILLDNKDNKDVKKFMKYYQSYMFHILDIKYAELTFDGLCIYIGALIRLIKQEKKSVGHTILKEFYNKDSLTYNIELDMGFKMYDTVILYLFYIKDYIKIQDTDVRLTCINYLIKELSKNELTKYFNPQNRTCFFLNKQFIQDEKDRYS